MEDAMALVCNLPQGVLAQRRVEIQTLLQNRTGFSLQPDGVELAFALSDETARSLLEFISFERACCKTFTYELAFAPPHDSVILRMKAPLHQVEALQALYSSLA
jgi:hypothetical protein